MLAVTEIQTTKCFGHFSGTPCTVFTVSSQTVQYDTKSRAQSLVVRSFRYKRQKKPQLNGTTKTRRVSS